MTITELKSQKEKLEKDIRDLLNNFVKETGCTIEDLDFLKIKGIANNEEICKVLIKVNI